jgi:hypothetical protein
MMINKFDIYLINEPDCSCFQCREPLIHGVQIYTSCEELSLCDKCATTLAQTILAIINNGNQGGNF